MNRNVLYVDDEIDNLVVFEATFEDDFDIWTASSGEEALKLLEQHPFAVVVADHRMPGMTGAELFEILRHRYPHSKRIMLTGYAEPEAMLDAINQGQIFYFVKKPWETEAFFSILVRAIEAYELSIVNMALTDQLVAADRCATLGRVAAQVAHEMGNNLCILPLLELIETNYRDKPDLMMNAEFARQMYEKLVTLIDEIKSFVRFEQIDSPRNSIRLAEVIAELLEFLRYDSSLNLQHVKFQVHSEVNVLGNKIKLQQVLVNLLKNAEFATRERGEQALIEVSLQTEDNWALICVKDNGVGMSVETVKRIWEPFFTTKSEEGNGLGLDITRRIVESHDGKIKVESEPGGGTTFKIYLPCSDESLPVNGASVHLSAPTGLQNSESPKQQAKLWYNFDHLYALLAAE